MAQHSQLVVSNEASDGDSDAAWMQGALKLARRGEGGTRPNPPVGAVVVRNGLAIGRGYHRRAGGPHAEVYAIRRAGGRAEGATLYVTLEPCSTRGRTPPCTDLIIASGIRRVVVSVQDSNPAHQGKGLRRLRRAGIDVCCGVAAQAGRELIAPFAQWITSGRPLVTLKLAMTLDGRIADARRASRWITSPPARRLVDDLRRRSDAVIVGSGTACADDPSLLCRSGRRSNYYRVIVDSHGRVPLKAKVLNDAEREMTVIATSCHCLESRRDKYRKLGADVWTIPGRGKHVSVSKVLERLGQLGCLRVMCEGGAGLAHALIEGDLVDECWFFVAPKVLGAADALPAVYGRGWRLDVAPEFRFTECRQIGPDVLLKAVRKRSFGSHS